MARTKLRDIPEGQDYVVLPEPKKSTLPNAKRRQEIMSNPETRTLMAEIINNVRVAFRKPRVTSNHELIERIDEYFEMAANRQMPATIEELSLFCGVTSTTLNEWKNGRHVPFHDGEETGLTTSSIVKKAVEMMHSVDAALAEAGKINTIAYVFRSKNYYGMTDKQEVVVTPNTEQTSMTKEQIEEFARNLPDTSSVIDTESTVD